jgi:hypothetical protein
MKAAKKTKAFDAVKSSRRWRIQSSRELAGLTYEQLHVRLTKFASAEVLLKPAPRSGSAPPPI